MKRLKQNWFRVRGLLKSGTFWISIFFAWIIIDCFAKGDMRGGEQGLAIYFFIIGTGKILKGISNDDKELLFLNEAGLKDLIEEKSKNSNTGWILMLIAFFILFSIQ